MLNILIGKINGWPLDKWNCQATLPKTQPIVLDLFLEDKWAWSVTNQWTTSELVLFKIAIRDCRKYRPSFGIWKILASNLEIVGTLDSRYGLEDECQDITFRIITTFDGRGRCVVVSFYLLPRLLKNCWYTMTPSTRQKLKYHTFFWSCLAFDLLEFFYSESQF